MNEKNDFFSTIPLFNRKSCIILKRNMARKDLPKRRKFLPSCGLPVWKRAAGNFLAPGWQSPVPSAKKEYELLIQLEVYAL